MRLRPAGARWFEMLTARDDLTHAIEAIARTGSVELETLSDTRTTLNLQHLQDRMEEYNRLARRYQPYWPPTELRTGGAPGSPGVILDRALVHLLAWERDAAPLVQQGETLRDEQSELQLLQEMLATGTPNRVDFALLAGAGPALAARLFVLPVTSRITQLPGSVLVQRSRSASHDFLLAVGLPADLQTLSTELANSKGRSVMLPHWLQGDAGMALAQVRQRLATLEQQQQELGSRIDALAKTHHLADALCDISRLEWFLTHVGSLPVSENFAWVTGWTSDMAGARLQAALRDAGIQAVTHFPRAPGTLTPPMVLQNPWWARPFELFSRLLGTPAANEADPSRLLAFIAPLLFGYMFGDVGQGLVLLVAGSVLQRRWPLLRIFIANGIASIVFGFVFGSVFGNDTLLPALWLHPMQDPLTVLLVPLAGGVVILLLGLMLNAVEYVWRGELQHWLHIEAAVLVLYVSIICALFEPWAVIVSMAALLWYFAGSLLHARQRPWATLLVATGTLLESMLQLLINTVSFVRVGAFALAHGGLSMTVMQMAEATGNPLAGAAVLVAGNVLIIVLEGLVVTIQMTRLILFEFFVRFLRGSGRMFRPLTAPGSNSGNRRTS